MSNNLVEFVAKQHNHNQFFENQKTITKWKKK